MFSNKSLMAMRAMLGSVVLPTVLLLLGGELSTDAAALRTATSREQAVNTTQPEVRKLEVGRAVERELRGGESHTYEIELPAGQYLKVVVGQRGIDVVVIVTAPDSKQLMEVDSPNGTQGPEPVAVITESTGVFIVVVRSLENDAPPGRYEILVQELRAATENDRALQLATALSAEVERLSAAGKYDAAIPLAARALSIQEKTLALEDADTAVLINRLARLFYKKGDYSSAEPLHQRALAISEKVLGLDHVDVAKSVNYLALLYEDKGDYHKAERLYERALAIREKALGPDHLDVAQSLSNLALFYKSQGDSEKAGPLLHRVLATKEKALGPDHLEVATSLSNLAVFYLTKGEYQRAEPLLQRALTIEEKALGPDHIEVAISLNNLAGLYYEKGDYAKAEPLLGRALKIQEKEFGPDHSAVARTLNNLGELYQSKGDYARTEPLLRRALDFYEKALGPDHRDVAHSLNSLANLYNSQGEYVRAERLLLRALEIDEKALGPDHREVARSLNNLASLYDNKGDYAKGEPLYIRALAIHEKALGAEHPDTATSLNNLANLYYSKGDYAKAEPHYIRALAIREKALGAGHPDTATSINSLAELYRAKGDYAKAEPLSIRTLTIIEKALGAEHPWTANSLNNLALLYQAKGDYAKAESLCIRALAIREKALGTEHPDTSNSLSNLAGLYRGKGDYVKAVDFQSRCNDVSDRDLVRNLASGSERQKLTYLNQTSAYTDSTISLHAQSAPNDVDAKRAALKVLLQRKGRALDAMTDAIATLRRRVSLEGQELLNELQGARSQLSVLTLRGPGREGLAKHKETLKALEDQEEKLQNEISQRSAEFRAQSQTQLKPVTIEVIQKAIPQGAALIEFAQYRPVDPKEPDKKKRFGKPRFVAYVLPSQGESHWAELGDAESINKKIDALRKALRDKRRQDVRRLARAVDRNVMQPVRKLLGRTRHVFLSPDGALNLIPFAALVDERGQYLVNRYLFTQLTSGRDLLRLQERIPSKQKALVIADPDFGEVKQPDATRAVREAEQSSQSVLEDLYFAPLKATAEEARELSAILPDAETLTREKATEAALKSVSGPRILHIATHGFFLDELAQVQTGDEKEQTRILKIKRVSTKAAGDNDPATLINPLMRSGLGLAGANTRTGKDGNDGILTALEASGLDLWGTKLVVLSACDTGVGEVKAGDGVYGLRRALVLAGSESQMISLWPVSDRGTRELMIAYYRGLKRGEGRSEALRRVQMRMLGDPKRRHPFYWASFIQSGEWANLDGKR